MFVGQMAYPVSIEAAGPSVAVHLPLTGDVLVGWGGDRLEYNHHGSVPPQRWGYDLMREPAFTGSDHLEDYGCYGVTVFSPAVGTIVHIKDGELDNIPGRLPESSDSLLGNSIGVRLDSDPDVVVFMAHFKKGSVRVRFGQRVRAGQPVARCGNSGNTTEPHVHLHAERDPLLDIPEMIGQLGVPVPITFFLEDGTRMPIGGENGETVRADPNALPQKELAVPLSPKAPWSVRIDDGSHNQFWFRQAQNEQPSFEYDPVTPLESSSGTYSGGTPLLGTLTADQVHDLWEHLHRLAGERDNHIIGERPKGSVAFTLDIPVGTRAFVLGTIGTQPEFKTFLESFRGKTVDSL